MNPLVFTKSGSFQQIFHCTAEDLKLLNENAQNWYWVGEQLFDENKIVNPITSWHVVYQGAIEKPAEITTVLSLLPKTIITDHQPKWVETMLQEIKKNRKVVCDDRLRIEEKPDNDNNNINDWDSSSIEL